MKNLRDLMGSAWAALPGPGPARWAAALFSLSVLTFLISLAACQAFLAASGLVYAAHLVLKRPGAGFLPVKLPLALFCLFSVLSVFWAANPAVGWFAIRKLVLFLIWLLAVNLIVTERHLRGLLQALFAESALAGVVATVQFVAQYHAVSEAHPGQVYLYMISTRIHGFMGHWMNFGGQQMLVFSALLAFLLLRSRTVTRDSGLGTRGPQGRGMEDKGSVTSSRDSSPEPRIGSPESRITSHESRLWWLLWATVGLSIVLNFTRGVWLGCFVATLYLVARWKARLLWVLPVFVVFAYLGSPSLVRRRVWLALHPTQEPALAIRFEMWSVGLRMIRAHPWLGVGPNNIEREYPLYLPQGTSPMLGYHSHLHDNFLQFGAERGLPCLAAWVWLMGALGWQISRIRRRLTQARWVADASFAAWLALLFEGCFEFNFGTSPVLMVFLFITSLPFVADRIEHRKGSG